MILRLTQKRFQLILEEGKQKLEEERQEEEKTTIRDVQFSSHKNNRPIPSIIYIMTNKEKKTGNTAGRPAGTTNFSVTELTALFQAMEDILPVGSDQWTQLAQIHAAKYPGRCLAAIRRKYNNLSRQKTPTGDPLCPPFVKWAKRIKWRLATKVELGHCEEPFDLVEGHPDTYTEPVPEAVASASVASVAAPVACVPDAPSGITSATTPSSKRSYNKADAFLETMKSEMNTAVATQNSKFDKLNDAISALTSALLADKKRGRKKASLSVDEIDSESDSDDDLSIAYKPKPVSQIVHKRLSGKRVKRSNPRYAV